MVGMTGELDLNFVRGEVGRTYGRQGKTIFAARLSHWVSCFVALLLCSSGAFCGQRSEFIGRGNSSLSWGVTEVRDVDNKNLAQGKIGDRIFVRIKNFDGWIIEQIEGHNYPQSQPPNKEVAKLINLGLFKGAIDARHDAGGREDWFKADAGPGSAQNEDAGFQAFKVKYATLLEQVRGAYPDSPYQAIREASAYMQAVFDDQIGGLHLKINDYTFNTIAPLSSRISAEESSGPDSYHLVPFDLDPQVDEDVWQKLRTHVFPWGPVNLTLVAKLTDREHNFPTAVVSPDNPQASELISPKPFRLYTVDPLTLYAAIIVVLFLLVVFVSVAFRTDLLRDPTRNLRADMNFPFSLSRLQMAFWLFVVVSSFLFLFVATQKVTVLNTTCLWLIGIGSGTALGAAIITPSTDGNASAQIARNKQAQSQAEAARATLKDLVKKQRSVNPLSDSEQQLLATLKVNLPKSYSGFSSLRQMLMDVISDDTEGVAIYRFQMLAWTIVLGFVFAFKVASDRAIPTFDAATLGLLGISSGTYLGFKLRSS
jgi:hypothetical protein